MQINLTILDHPDIRVSGSGYSTELDDVRSILTEVCGELVGQAQFTISGFGQEKWPVEVGFDLAVLLEQLPTLISAIRLSEATELDMYEQGIERQLYFVPEGLNYSISCASYGNWTPSHAVELFDKTALLEMLLLVQNEFLRALRQSVPVLLEHPFIVDWLKAGDG